MVVSDALRTCVFVLNRPLTIPGSIRSIPNRIVYQPMEMNSGLPNGAPSARDFDVLRKQFSGKPGINWLQATAVMEAAKGRVNQWMITPGNVNEFRSVTDLHQEIHPEGLLLLQLTHSGRFALSPVSPYAVPDRDDIGVLKDRDILDIQDRFVESFQLAEAAGFHGAELKGCHKYFVSNLTAPQNGKRDGWSFGGPSMEERMSFFSDTMGKIRKSLVNPDKFIMGFRFSMYFGLPGEFGSLPGAVEEDLAYTDARELVRIALENGIQILNVSSGVPAQTPLVTRPTNDTPMGVFDHFRWTQAVKEWVGKKAVVVGSAYSYLRDGNNKLLDAGQDPFKKSFLYWAAKNIVDGHTDMAGVGRQILSDPLFAVKILEGRLSDIDWCKACGLCSVMLKNQVKVGCAPHDPVAKQSFQEDTAAGRITR